MSDIVKTYEQLIRSKTSNEDIVIYFVMQRYVDKQHGYHVGGWAYALYPSTSGNMHNDMETYLTLFELA